MAVNPDLLNQAQRFADWLQHQALPLWVKHGQLNDGGSVERLTVQATPNLQDNRRVRVHARQIYAYSAAVEMGWLDRATGEKLVEGLHDYVNTHGRNPDTPVGYAHVLTGDNQLVDGKLDLYDCAFHIFAATYRYKVFAKQDALQQADGILNYLDSQLKGPGLGWLEGNYIADVRRQNPHMHLFETFLALYEATNQARYLDYARQMFALFEQVFFDKQHGVLLEFFDHHWAPAPDGKGQLIEPGHMFEWVWLLRRYQRHTGTETGHYCEQLVEHGLHYGLDAQSGLIFDEVSLSGEITKPTKRNWPVIEMIKAYLAQAEFGVAGAEQQAADAIALLFRYFIEPANQGLFFDQLDSHNRVANDSAPASILYHLMLAAVEATLYCNNAN